MDYEKAYKEALERAKAGKPLDEVFPELKESEDERIRKYLIDVVKDYCKGSEYEGCIAYLEKQKEQKPNIELIQKSWYMDGYHDGRYNNEPKWLIQTGKEGPRYKENPKYGTQQPAEWTIDDAKPGDVLNSTRVQATIIYKGKADDGKHILAYCALQKGIFISQEMLWDKDFELASEYWKNALYEAIVRKGYDWDADRLELKKKEGKPAEWSEEDEDTYKRVYSLFNNANEAWYKAIFAGCFPTITKEKVLTMLKSLHPQPKQEWSEEDGRHLDRIQMVLESWDRSHTSLAGLPSTIPNDIDWLKSLRPSQYCENCKLKRSVENWKPSEEQVNALKVVARGYPADDLDAIDSLLNDLEKL